ncbi:MAG: DNA repair protein RadA [Armatimonadetes bacterium]|nr:DNA repair protein RadA [Armatimonadota bacterium]
MARVSTRFVCQACGHEALKWMGRCPECSEWNSFAEEAAPRRTAAGGRASVVAGHDAARGGPQPVGAIDAARYPRMNTGIGEFDRVLGGGVVAGSLVLVGGDPGVGKSTLLLQVAEHLAQAHGPVLYVSGEESTQQIKLRADRLGVRSERLLLLSETDMELIEGHVQATRPHFLIIDSIQTMSVPEVESAPGTVTQVRESAARLMRLAKHTHLPVFLIGHVTKEGALAGPRVLEHMVDTVLYFEGDRHQAFQVLRAVKNRFGSTDELGIFEMRETGLSEVLNPSEVFLAHRRGQVPGSVVVPAIEGTRPLLVEAQALVASAHFTTPRRMAAGGDYNRMCLTVAVLEKRLGLPLGTRDVYLSIAGGVRVVEPAADLGIAVAIASSFRDAPVDPAAVFIGEVGLAGEVRPVQQTEKRLNEAARLGFRRAFAAAAPGRSADGSPPGGDRRRTPAGLVVVAIETVRQAVDLALQPEGER